MRGYLFSWGEFEYEVKRLVFLLFGLVFIVIYFVISLMMYLIWSIFYVEIELEKKRIKRNWNEKKNKEKIFEMIESCFFIVSE